MYPKRWRCKRLTDGGFLVNEINEHLSINIKKWFQNAEYRP